MRLTELHEVDEPLLITLLKRRMEKNEAVFILMHHLRCYLQKIEFVDRLPHPEVTDPDDTSYFAKPHWLLKFVSSGVGTVTRRISDERDAAKWALKKEPKSEHYRPLEGDRQAWRLEWMGEDDE